ncbi:MAG: SIMPL domain-containing protein [Zoogloeaceae bacterium]|nr:SIMPL domain-containing protein [Zoogloeaceae bacterium]
MKFRQNFFLLLFSISTSALAATTVDLSAEASQPAANDLARATLFAEVNSPSPGDAANKVNGLINNAISTAKKYGRVKVSSGNTHTYPVYAKDRKIESWRMRSEIQLESSDTASLSELIGKLQRTLGVAGITLSPASETRKKAESAAMIEAIAAFKERAKIIADTLGKPYRIKHLSVGNQSYRPPTPMLRAAPMAAMEAAPMPVEAGESSISVTINGQIELAD